MFLLFLISTAMCLFSNVISNNTVKKQENSKSEKRLFNVEPLINNFNDFMNNGINKTTFNDIMGNNVTNIYYYNQIINTLADQSFVLPYNQNTITEIKTLYSLDPIIKEYLITNKYFFLELKEIINEIGPDLCTAFNLNFDTLIKLYNYIFINEENDGVLIQNILSLLKIPNKQIQQFNSVFSFIEGNITISEFFKSINCDKEYFEFVKSVLMLKVPFYDEKFLSYQKVQNVISNSIKLIESINQNLILKNLKVFVKPFIKYHLFNPFNIYDISIYERAKVLYNVIEKIHTYSNYCSYYIETQNTNLKCKIYSELVNIIFYIYKDFHNNKSKEVIFDEFKDMMKNISEQKFNITVFLIDKWGLDEKRAKVIYQSVYNVYGPEYKYQSVIKLLIQDSTLKTQENDDSYSIVLNNFSNYQDFLKAEKLPLIKIIFENLNISQYFNYYSEFVIELNKYETFTEFVDVHKKEIINLINVAIDELQTQPQTQTQKVQHEKKKKIFSLNKKDYIVLFSIFIITLLKEFVEKDGKSDEEKKKKFVFRFIKNSLEYIISIQIFNMSK